MNDISATGVMVGRPAKWQGAVGETVVIDMLFGDSVDIHVEARLVRDDGRQLGFAFAAIAEDRQVALWNLLGRYADSWER